MKEGSRMHSGLQRKEGKRGSRGRETEEAKKKKERNIGQLYDMIVGSNCRG